MILNRLYHERRRLALTVSVSFLAGYLLYLPYEVAIFSVPLPIMTGACYAVLVGLSAAMLCLLLPRLRFTVEMFALARLVVALAALLVPEISRLLVSSPVTNATAMVITAILLERGVRSRAAGRWARSPASFTLHAEIEASGASAGAAHRITEALRSVPGGSSATGFRDRALDRCRTSCSIPLREVSLFVWARLWLDDAFGRRGIRLSLERSCTAAPEAASRPEAAAAP